MRKFGFLFDKGIVDVDSIQQKAGGFVDFFFWKERKKRGKEEKRKRIFHDVQFPPFKQKIGLSPLMIAVQKKICC